MTDPVLTITTGSTGAQLVTAFDLNATALADLQAAVSLLATQVLSLPAGAYVAPGAGQYQTYGTNATPWAAATSQGKVNLVNAPSNGTNGWGDIWSVANGTSFAITNDSSGGLVFRMLTTTAGVPVVTASLALSTPAPTGNNSFGWEQQPLVVSAYPISSTVVKVLYSYSYYYYASYYSSYPQYYEAYITWTGSALSAAYTANSGGSISNSQVAQSVYGITNKRGYLCGASSALAIAVMNNYNGAGISGGQNLLTRGNDQTYANQGIDTNIAWLGGGFSVSATVFAVPADNVGRLVFQLHYTDDQQTMTLAQVRMTGYSWGSWVGIWAFSNTMVLAVFKDAGGQQYATLLSVATGASPSMGVLTTSIVGYLGSVAFSPLQPLCWNSAGNDMYLYGGMNGTSMYFYRVNYNPTTGVLTCTTRITVPLGGASAGAQAAAIAGQTVAAPIAWWQSGTDQLTVVFYSTATASGIWLEVLNLS